MCSVPTAGILWCSERLTLVRFNPLHLDFELYAFPTMLSTSSASVAFLRAGVTADQPYHFSELLFVRKESTFEDNNVDCDMLK